MSKVILLPTVHQRDVEKMQCEHDLQLVSTKRGNVSLEQRRKRAIEWLGRKYLLHPDNRVIRKDAKPKGTA